MWLAYLDGQVLHKPLTAATTLPFAKLSMQLNAAPAFTFKLYKSHPLYDRVTAGVMQSTVTVERDGARVFSGRVASVEPNYISGLVTVTCEGDLARLNDTVVPPYDFTGSPRDFLALLLNAHNQQSPFKVRVGSVTVQDSNNYIVRSNETPARTLGELLAKTAKSALGGYVSIRDEGGEHWCDWTAEPQASGNQSAEVGVNVLTLTGKRDGTKIVTAIYPVGAKSTENGVTSIVNVSELPDGALGGGISKRGAYVVNDALEARYGWIADVRSWPDVHYPNILRDKAKAEAQALAFSEELTVTAVDLADAGEDVEHFALGQPVQVRAEGVEGASMVTAITYDLLKASGGSMKLGAAANTASGRSAEAASSANAAANAAAWAQATATFGNRWFYREDADDIAIARSVGASAPVPAGDVKSHLYLYDSGGAILAGDHAYVRGKYSAALIGRDIDSPENGDPMVTVQKNATGTGLDAIAFHVGTVDARILEDGTWEGFPTAEIEAATQTRLGGVKIGAGLEINSAGVASVKFSMAPKASKSSAGIVQIGTGLAVTSAGLLSVNLGGWQTVSVNKSLFPSGFSTTRDVTVLKNDLLKLVYISAVYDTDGTTVSVPGNSVICVINDSTLRSGQTLNVGYGLRYGTAGLADWTARVYPYSSRYAGIKTPTWAFSGTSVKYQALLPYAAFGIA